MSALKELIQQKSSLAKSNLLENFEPPQFSEIELDEQEIEEALRLAREQKFFKLQREEYNKKLLQPVSYKKATAEELFQMFIDAGFKTANLQHENKIKNLCLYFANDNRSAYDRNKGLLMMGNIGSGKTSLMKFFSINQLHSFKVENMLDITSDYKIHGEAGVKCYSTNIKKSPDAFGNDTSGYCFDDVGTEEIPARHYGESKNVFAEIIMIRYNQSQLPFASTHMTTNKNEQDLLESYGSRLYDRLKEMFNVVTFDNDSFRK